MTAALWVGELVQAFWHEVGQPEPFPRTLRGSLAWVPFSVTIKEKAGLGIDLVENYLAHQGIRWRCGQTDRPLHACLVAYQGAAWISLDSQDQPCERTYSLAHELAHFLRHYRQPRQRAVAALGPGILDVFDGKRALRPSERLHALLRGMPTGVHVHLMERDEVAVSPAVEQAEWEADLLAWELLAPADEVRSRLGQRDGFEQAITLLVEEFDLPAGVAAQYADVLFPEQEDSPVVLSLKKVLGARRDRAT
jgi:hypothetical protein